MADDQTKEKIMDALRKMMMVKPLEKISITDISNMAGISRPTFYYHFHSIFEIFDWYLNTHVPCIRGSVPPPRVPAATACMMVMCNFFKTNKDLVLEFRRVYPLQFIEHNEMFFRRVFDNLLNHVYPEYEPKKDLETVIEFLAIGYAGFVERWFRSGMDMDISGMFCRFFNYLEACIADNTLAKIVDNIPPEMWIPHQPLKL